MTKIEIQEIDSLRSVIKKHSYDYHTLNNSKIPDVEYDKLIEKLNILELKNGDSSIEGSPTQQIGSDPLSNFKNVNHSVRMLSIKTETNNENIGKSFVSRIKKDLNSDTIATYIGELKYDGLAVNLKYENGILTQALTRGNGDTGEDVTENIKAIKDIPLTIPPWLPSLVEIRGEIYMSHLDFEKLNQSQRNKIEDGVKGIKLFTNPRNAAAGFVRRISSNESSQRPLSFFAYGIGQISENIFTSHYEMLMAFKTWGFKVSEHTRVLKSTLDMEIFYSDIFKLRDELPFDIDGVVFKVDELKLQTLLGCLNREPRWAVTHKYPAQEQVTELLDIIVQVGRTGKLTPVAKLMPIFVGGVMVSSATLHNENEINRKQLSIGDKVIVRRAGDVIPEIIGVFQQNIFKNKQIYKLPVNCPICNSIVERENDSVDYRCTGGLICKAQQKQAVLHFAQRNAVEIIGLGDKLVDKLVDLNIVKNISDLYLLNASSFKQIEGMADRSISNILNAIEKSKVTTLPRFIFALGIRHVGEATASLIVKKFKNLENILKADLKSIMEITGIGETTAASIFSFTQNKINTYIINQLIYKGVTWPNELILKKYNSKITNKTFVITGRLTTLGRSSVKLNLENLGGRVINSINENVDYLITGSEPGSKLSKALKINISILTENDLLNMLKHND